MGSKWRDFIENQATEPYFVQLQKFVERERLNHQVYPPASHTYAALNLTPLESTRVVILGQDPYHGDSQANGLAFSVDDNVPIPPSLRNIFAELHTDVGITRSGRGDLSTWAHQGVLLLNTTLTVRAGEPMSHRDQGWETLTDRMIALINVKPEPVVFVLWGAHARGKKSLITNASHLVLEAPHPSPLSAHRGFFGSKPYSQINNFLSRHGSPEINWHL